MNLKKYLIKTIISISIGIFFIACAKPIAISDRVDTIVNINIDASKLVIGDIVKYTLKIPSYLESREEQKQKALQEALDSSGYDILLTPRYIYTASTFGSDEIIVIGRGANYK